MKKLLGLGLSWDTMKAQISEPESFTQEKCTGVGNEWAKIVATMRNKK